MTTIVERFRGPLCGLLWALILVGYPLTAAIATLLGLPNRPTSIGVRGFTLALAIGLFVVAGVRERRLHRGIFWLPLIMFWSWYLARLAYDSAFMPENLRLTPFEYVLWAVGGALIPMLAFMVRHDDRDLDWALWTTFGFGTLACALVVAINILIGVGDPSGSGRLALATLNPISTGHLGLTVALLGAAVFLRSTRHWYALAASVFLPVTLGSLVALTAATRGVVLAFVSTWALILWFARNKRAVAFVAVTAPLIVLGALAVERGLGYKAVSRVVEFSNAEEPAKRARAPARDQGPDAVRTPAPSLSMDIPLVRDQLRIQFVVRAWEEFIKKPLLGAGIEPLGEYPHNLIIESFLAIGILGGAVFLTLVLMSALAAWKVLKGDPRHFWIGLLFAQHMVWAMLSGSIYGHGATWCLMAAVIVRAAQIGGATGGRRASLPGASIEKGVA